MQTCPLCKLVSPSTAIHCDCGYDFEARQMDHHLLKYQEKQADFFESYWVATQVIRGMILIIGGPILIVMGYTLSMPIFGLICGFLMCCLGLFLLVSFFRNHHR